MGPLGDEMEFGTPHRHFARTDSTNTRARELAAAGAPHGTVVTADEQTAGRGRQGRTWTAPCRGSLLYSAILRPLGERPLLPLAAALAVCEAAEGLAPGLSCGVKWPNDVQLDGRKLAGILIEARVQEGWAVIGVGLNLSIEPHEFSPELRQTAVSLFTSHSPRRGRSDLSRSKGQIDPSAGARAAGGLSERLAHWVDADAAAILSAWRERDALHGREVAWGGGSGVAEGVDDLGRLVVVAAGGRRLALVAGEVHLLAT